MIYKELIIYVDESVRESLIGDLLMLNFESFTDSDQALHAFMPSNRWDDSLYKKIGKKLESYQTQGLIQSYKLEVQGVHPQNWQEQWERTIEPIYIGKNIIIHPSWQTIDASDDTIDVIIDPKMSFGTGHHETTQMMIELLRDYMGPGKSVLDVGTGSGILAIVAAKMGAGPVVGIDTDQDAINDALENCRINGLQNIIRMYTGELAAISDIASISFDLVIANIERKTIIEMFDLITMHVSKTGMLLLSGLLEEDYQYIEQAGIRKKLSIEKTIKSQSKTADTWIAIALQKQ